MIDELSSVGGVEQAEELAGREQKRMVLLGVVCDIWLARFEKKMEKVMYVSWANNCLVLGQR